MNLESIQRELEKAGLHGWLFFDQTDFPPIVGVNVNAADSHYAPPARKSAPVRRGDQLLLDLWAKVSDEPEAVYYDITWMAFCGEEMPARMRDAFSVVVGAFRDWSDGDWRCEGR
jgi:Xaa-Pro aminopeptidase